MSTSSLLSGVYRLVFSPMKKGVLFAVSLGFYISCECIAGLRAGGEQVT
jgi:hypothetical protein